MRGGGPAWIPPTCVLRDPTISPEELDAAVVLIAPRVEFFEGPRVVDQLRIGAPGSPVVEGLMAGEGDHTSKVVVLTFKDPTAFLSTDRACLPPRRRPPVVERWAFLLQPTSGGLHLQKILPQRRLVPWEVALRGMEIIEQTQTFRKVWSEFIPSGVASRLAERPAAPLPGLLTRLRGRVPPALAPPPDHQLKYVLEGWLPPGVSHFGEHFLDPRDHADLRLESENPLLLWTVEFWEKSAPRYIHWHFRGTLMRMVVDVKAGRCVAEQHFRV